MSAERYIVTVERLGGGNDSAEHPVLHAQLDRLEIKLARITAKMEKLLVTAAKVNELARDRAAEAAS